MKKKIVLDCDGVLLDYNLHFGTIYQHAFNKELQIVNPKAYHAVDYWGASLSSQEKEKFYASFDEIGWSTMPAFEGAIEATHMLKKEGYDIIIVTSMNEKAKNKRIKNLEKLNFAFDDLYATGRTHKNINPKQEILNKLNPEWFVDDLITNFKGLDKTIQCALIDSNLQGSPNADFKKTIGFHTEHPDLTHFVKNIILQPKAKMHKR
jgi:FMN phosphatase YigB (HAD superfamily)